MQGAKQCAACGLRFPVRYFQKLTRQPDGRHILCRGCCSTQNMKRNPGGQSGCVSCSVQQLPNSSDIFYVLLGWRPSVHITTATMWLRKTGAQGHDATQEPQQCRGCGLRLSANHFALSPTYRTGRHSLCRQGKFAFASKFVHVGVHVVCRARSATQCVAAIQHHMHLATKHEVECTMHTRSRG